MNKLKDAKELLELVKKLSTWIQGEKSDALRIECMNGIGTYTTTIDAGTRFSKWVRKIGQKSIEFPISQVYDVKMYSLKPMLSRINGAVHYSGDKILVDLTKGLEYDIFKLEVAYRMEEEWLSGLVHQRSSTEPLRDALKYNLSAQLKDPSILINGFKDVDVDDFPITTRVHIQEHLNTALPIITTYKRMREIEGELLADYDPHHATKMIELQKERFRIKKKLESDKPTETLRELLVFLRPTRFLGYLSTQQDFRIHLCQWGELLEGLGTITLPKAMEVTTRTDLNLDKPASKGVLMYESSKFLKDVSNVMNKTKRL